MTVRYKYLVGRYINPETNRAVNIHCGQRRDNGCDVHFFLYRKKRVLVGEDFRKWNKPSS
jgi:hypothetical protein